MRHVISNVVVSALTAGGVMLGMQPEKPKPSEASIRAAEYFMREPDATFDRIRVHEVQVVDADGVVVATLGTEHMFARGGGKLTLHRGDESLSVNADWTPLKQQQDHDRTILADKIVAQEIVLADGNGEPFAFFGMDGQFASIKLAYDGEWCAVMKAGSKNLGYAPGIALRSPDSSVMLSADHESSLVLLNGKDPDTGRVLELKPN